MMVDGFNICAGALSFEEALCPPYLELDHLLSSDLSASINTTFNGKLFQLSGKISKRLLTLHRKGNFKQVFFSWNTKHL